MVSGIYAIVNIVNDKIYVGSAVNFSERWRLHNLALSKNKHHNRHLQAAYNKYGKDSFIFVVIEYTKVWLLEREEHWINTLDSTNIEIGYNICKATRNRHGVKISEETRVKLIASHLRNKHSEETKARMSESKIGNTINNGRKWSAETVAKRAASNTGKKRSKEAKAKMSIAKTGIKHSEEAKLKMRLAKLGKKKSEEAVAKMRGPRVISEETRTKLVAAANKRWKVVDNKSDLWA